MCMGGGSSVEIPATVPEAAQMPQTKSGESAQTTVNADSKRRAAATGERQGAGGTILTSSRGVTQQGTTAIKTLLGE